MFVLHCRRLLKPVLPPAARLSPALYFAQYTKIVQKKKQKSSAVEPEPSSPRPAPLSPEQLDRIARNKRAALARLASAQTPPGFGESWTDGLSAEFGKPYFKQVRGREVNILRVVSSLVLNELNNFTSLPTADEFCLWREETPHCVPTCWTCLHLDADVWHPGCKFNCNLWHCLTPKYKALYKHYWSAVVWLLGDLWYKQIKSILFI